MSETRKEIKRLQPYLSKYAIWALSVGTSIGWGSLVVTSKSYLGQAGPYGSVIGLLVGAGLMLLMCRSFHYLSNIFPDAGGVYAYTKNVFGYDRAFLVAWFLSLTYISMFWANATSLPLFARYFMGGIFKFGYLYQIFGYDVYFGDALLTLIAIALVTFLCSRNKKISSAVMVGLVAVFTIGITIAFAFSMLKHDSSAFSCEPAFIPDKNIFSQIMSITLISAWAFVGFENVTHSSEEFSFPASRLYKILFTSVVTSTALYIFIIILSVTAYPADCVNWLDYIRNLSRYDGIAGLPAFYAANHYLGNTGVFILMLSLLALVLTSLIGNIQALSRLWYAAARDDILPKKFARLNSLGIPENAMILTALVSIPIPFVGRTAIGWIVDVTTIGATLMYGFVSAAAFKISNTRQDKREKIESAITMVIMTCFAIYLMFPNIFSNDMLETETYILLIIWSVLGFFYFRRIITRDHARRFGKAIIVWISLLSMIVLMALIWSGRRQETVNHNALQGVADYYEGKADPSVLALDPDAFMNKAFETVHVSNVVNILIVIGLFVMALGAMLINYLSMKKWESKAVKERDDAREVAYKDPLTGVNSKHAYVEQEKEMAQKIYAGEAGEFGLVVCDVNGLKHINDTLGHKAGDIYIQDACKLICDYFKHSPVYRIGGDEFAIVLQGHDYEHRHELIDDLNEVIEKNVGTTNVVVSLGLGEFDQEKDNTFHSVFTRADGFMYERKKQLKQMGAIVRE